MKKGKGGCCGSGAGGCGSGGCGGGGCGGGGCGGGGCGAACGTGGCRPKAYPSQMSQPQPQPMMTQQKLEQQAQQQKLMQQYEQQLKEYEQYQQQLKDYQMQQQQQQQQHYDMYYQNQLSTYTDSAVRQTIERNKVIEHLQQKINDIQNAISLVAKDNIALSEWVIKLQAARNEMNGGPDSNVTGGFYFDNNSMNRPGEVPTGGFGEKVSPYYSYTNSDSNQAVQPYL